MNYPKHKPIIILPDIKNTLISALKEFEMIILPILE